MDDIFEKVSAGRGCFGLVDSRRGERFVAWSD